MFCSKREITLILQNLASLKRRLQPVEFRVNKETMLKELNHPFYYIQYKDREVAIVGTEE